MVSRLPIFSVDYLKSILFYDPLSGNFTWKVNKSKRTYINQKAGWIDKKGYRQISIDDEQYLAHILAWFYMTGEWPSQQIDHKNRIKNDNRYKNLRLATDTQQQANRDLQKNNTSGYKGVTWHNKTKKWRAQIRKDKKHYSLGLYLNLKEAAEAYNKKALKLFGPYAKFNII